jgi:hypothetical protein
VVDNPASATASNKITYGNLVTNMSTSLVTCSNGGGWLYNPVDVSNDYYNAGGSASVTMTTGTTVIVFIHADWNHVGGKTDYFSVAVSGATTIAASDSNAIIYDGANSNRITTGISFCLTVNAGSNVFTVRAKNTTGSYAQTINSTRLQVLRVN